MPTPNEQIEETKLFTILSWKCESGDTGLEYDQGFLAGFSRERDQHCSVRMERIRLSTLTVWTFLLAVESQNLTISVSEGPVHAAAGDPVTLSARPSVEVRSGSWRHNGRDVLIWIGSTVDITGHYTGQAELVHNVSLLLKRVTVSHSGEYIVTMTTFSNTAASARINLLVFEPISSVYITSNVSNPVRENGSVCLTCNVVGDCTGIIWSFNGSVVPSNERILPSSENVTLTIIGVEVYHTGEYQCTAHSPVGVKASEPYFLQIAGTSDQGYTRASMVKLVIILAILVPFLLTCCVTLARIRIHCCDRQCSCYFLSRYLFYYWVSCCNRDALENICDNQETGNLAGTWIACCSSRSKKECDSPCLEEPRTLSGLSVSCCSRVLRSKSNLQDETKPEAHGGVLLSCCGGRSPDESERKRHCWVSCCRTGLKRNVEASNYRGLWMSCCDCGSQKDEQIQEHDEIRELCDFWIACCNKGSQESIGIYANPITSITGQWSNFSWTSTASGPAAEDQTPREISKESPVTKSTAKEFPTYAAVNKKNKMENSIQVNMPATIQTRNIQTLAPTSPE
ncbi:uncharacterized protein LOC144671548 [Cetorhinus maximus]